MMSLAMGASLKYTGTRYQFFWEDHTIPAEFRSGVSLHSHTMYSEESLDIVPRYAGRIPVLKQMLDASLDYGNMYWTPPLSPRQAHRVEEKQIHRCFELPGVVSLSDHDDIRAASMLRVLPRFQNAPISVEWTVPFGSTFFHAGVHNLPAAEAPSLMNMMRAYTAVPDTKKVKECLRRLGVVRDVLLVLNHPLWDENQIGKTEHEKTLGSLLAVAGDDVHALEVNGLRPWAENREVMRLAAATGRPVVSGGDRHGCEPNAILNLTTGSTFAEFADEIRTYGRSHVVFMPQYREPVKWRTMQTVVDILRTYPESFEGRRSWTERVMYRDHSGKAKPISALWSRGRVPKIFSAVSCGVDVAQWRGVRLACKTIFSLGSSEAAI